MKLITHLLFAVCIVAVTPVVLLTSCEQKSDVGDAAEEVKDGVKAAGDRLQEMPDNSK